MVGNENGIAGCDIEPWCAVNNDVIVFAANFLKMSAQDFFAVTACKCLFDNFFKRRVGRDQIKVRVLACWSESISSVRFPVRAKWTARFVAELVLPGPPLLFIIATIRADFSCSLLIMTAPD